MDSGKVNKNSTRTRIWVVTEVYYPESVSSGYYMTAVAEGLAEHADVKVICTQPNYFARGVKAPKFEHHNGVGIHRTYTTRLHKDVIPFRLINISVMCASMFLAALRRFGPGDRVLVLTSPPLLPFTTAVAALVKRASYTVLIHDRYPEILVAVGKTRRDSLLFRVFSRANRWLWKHAARIIAVGRDMQESIAEATSGLDVPVDFIPNWSDLESISPSPRDENPLLRELGLVDKFVFLYAGNIGHPTDIETIIEGASELKDDPRFHFLFIGGGAKRPWLEKSIQSKALANVTFLGQKPRSEQGVFLNACDVGLVSLVGGMRGNAMPSRTYNIMAAGKPVFALTDHGSEIARVIEDDRIGWHIPPGDAAGFVKMVRHIYEERSQLEEMGSRAFKAATEKYSVSAAVESYRKSMLSGEQPPRLRANAGSEF